MTFCNGVYRSNVCDVFTTNGSKNMEKGQAEPRTVYDVLYAPTIDVRRAQRGATVRSEFKKYFSFNFILTGFLFNNHKFVFLFGMLSREVKGECPKFKSPYLFFFLKTESATSGFI